MYYNCSFTNLYLSWNFQFLESKDEYCVHYHAPKTKCCSWNKVGAQKVFGQWVTKGRSRHTCLQPGDWKVGWEYEEEETQGNQFLIFFILANTGILPATSTLCFYHFYLEWPLPPALPTHTFLQGDLPNDSTPTLIYFSKLLWNLLAIKYILACDYILSWNFSNCFIPINFVSTLR